jgi:imidazolonepropionase-like amidohydrolase
MRLLRIVGWTCLALLLSACGWLAVGLLRPLEAIPRFGQDHRLIAITDVSVIDVVSGATLPGKTVLIEGGVIRRVEDAQGFELPPQAHRVEGAGRFLVPGLWDSHVHTLAHSTRLHFPLLTAHGVTAIRNLGDGCSWTTDTSCVPDAVQWAAQGDEARRLLPHSAVTASYHFERVGDALEAVRTVAMLRTRGDTLIKLQLEEDVPPGAAKAILEEAARRGLPVAGHLPASIDLLDPAFERMASIEHGSELLDHCMPKGEGADEGGVIEACLPVLRLMADRGTAFVPTFVASTGQDVMLGTHRRAEDDRLRFAPQVVAMVWTAYRALHLAGMDADDYARARWRHRMAMQLALLAMQSGVPVLAGTDALDPFVAHGESLHEELALLVQAGFTPAQALRAATHAPAVVHGQAGKRGQVIPGAHADLVLLRENPLQRIQATRSIEAVFREGRYFDAAELEALRTYARGQADSHALNARLWWAMLGG